MGALQNQAMRAQSLCMDHDTKEPGRRGLAEWWERMREVL